MSRRVMAAVVAGLLLAVGAGALDCDAQRPRTAEQAALFGPPAPALGLRGGYDFGAGAWSLGGHARAPVGPRQRGLLIPSGDLFFGRDRIDWQLNADAALGIGPLRLFYAGAGLTVLHRDFTAEDGAGEPGLEASGRETRTGANLFGGMEFPRVRAPTRALLEFRWTIVEGGAPFRIVVGINRRFGVRR